MESKKRFSQLKEVSKTWSILEQSSWWTNCCMTVTLSGICLSGSPRRDRKFYFDKVWLLLCMNKIMSLQAMMRHSTPYREKLHIIMPVPGIQTYLPPKIFGGMNKLINVFIISAYWHLLESYFTQVLNLTQISLLDYLKKPHTHLSVF